MTMMRILLSLLAVISLAALVAATTASAAGPQAARNDDADRVVHTMDLAEDDDAHHDPNPDNFEYEPVTVLGGRRWAVSAYEALTGRRLARTFKPAPHDAPVSPRAPLLLPSSLHPLKNKMTMMNSKRRSSGQDEAAVVDGEWLMLVGKRHRDDFVAVLEEMGHHLASRFGLGADQWFDVGALRRDKRAHDERRQRREEQRPWRLQARSEDGSQRAVALDDEMMVQVTVPVALRHRQHEIVESLRDEAWIEFIEPNVVMRSTATQTLSSSSPTYPWGLDRIDQRHLPLNERYEYVTPTSGVRVYVIDTGILTTHVGRAVWGDNTVDALDYDCYGHGTHVAGIVAGTNVGVAKDVTVVAVKALDCSGSGTAGTVSQGIAWVIDDCPVGVRCIISLSLGGEQSSVMDSAVKAAYNQGIVVVSAAGNSNVDACAVTPARSPYGITVGATNSDDSKAFFSNWGGCVNIWAPGVDIPSAYFTSDTTYRKLSGTSQATPFVTGALALYLGATKNVTPSEAAGAVYASATLNTVTGTDSSSINRFLYSQINRGVVPKTAADACTSSFPCTSVNGSLSGVNSVNVPSGQITVTSTVARYGYLQAWLEATADFDLRLQFYDTATLTWVNVATSSGGTGSEWIQFSTSATGAGQYRFQIFSSSAGLSGTYQFSYQVPSTAQAGKAQTAAASVVAPFWLSLLRAFAF